MNHDDLGLRWEHSTFPDGQPVLRADLARGDLYIRFTLSRRDDGRLELAGADMDDRLGIAGTTFDLDEVAVHLIRLLLDNRKGQAHKKKEEEPPCS